MKKKQSWSKNSSTIQETYFLLYQFSFKKKYLPKKKHSAKSAKSDLAGR